MPPCRALADCRYIVTDVGRQCINVVGMPRMILTFWDDRDDTGNSLASNNEHANKKIRTIMRASAEMLAAGLLPTVHSFNIDYVHMICARSKSPLGFY